MSSLSQEMIRLRNAVADTKAKEEKAREYLDELQEEHTRKNDVINDYFQMLDNGVLIDDEKAKEFIDMFHLNNEDDEDDEPFEFTHKNLDSLQQNLLMEYVDDTHYARFKLSDAYLLAKSATKQFEDLFTYLKTLRKESNIENKSLELFKAYIEILKSELNHLMNTKCSKETLSHAQEDLSYAEEVVLKERIVEAAEAEKKAIEAEKILKELDKEIKPQ